MLIPYDRYQRLLKGKAGEIGKEKRLEKDNDNENINTLEIGSEQEVKKEDRVIEKINQIHKIKSNSDNKEIEQESDISTKKGDKEVLHNKVAQRPPGVPNKIRKTSFKWESLF